MSNCIAIRVLNERCDYCFTGIGQTVQVKPIKCSRNILVCVGQQGCLGFILQR